VNRKSTLTIPEPITQLLTLSLGALSGDKALLFPDLPPELVGLQVMRNVQISLHFATMVFLFRPYLTKPREFALP